MNENPFETKGKNKGKNFKIRKKRKLSKWLGTLIVTVSIILILGFASSKVVEKYQAYKHGQKIEQFIDGGFSDITLTTVPHFVGDTSLLGRGVENTLTPENATKVSTEIYFNDSGNKYKYQNIIEPGVYTAIYEKGNDVNLITGGLTTINYKFGSSQTDNIMNEMYNLTITDKTRLSVEATSDFSLKFIPQDDYIQFDQTNVVPGVYTAGINIDSGEYELGSKTPEPINIVYQTDETSKIIATDKTPRLELKEGDSIIIDNEDTIVKAI